MENEYTIKLRPKAILKSLWGTKHPESLALNKSMDVLDAKSLIMRDDPLQMPLRIHP